MKKSILIFLSLLFIANSVWSLAHIVFEEVTHDFGTIKEIDGEVEYEFFFINAGDEPLIIEEVKSS